MRPLLSMEGVKKRPFKTIPYSLTYLTGDIHRFYNGPSPQYKIGGKNIISDYGSVKQRVILILILLISTPAVTTAFIKYYIPHHGFPKAIINNKGT